MHKVFLLRNGALSEKLKRFKQTKKCEEKLNGPKDAKVRRTTLQQQE